VTSPYLASAIDALTRLRDARGDNATFPSDAIWEYVQGDVPGPRQKPGVITALRRKGLIIETGGKTRAVTGSRARSSTIEYRLPRATSGAGASSLTDLSRDLVESAEGVLHTKTGDVARLCACLLAKRFVILTGLSGSGKTRVAQVLIRWLTASFEYADPFVVGSVLPGVHAKYTITAADALGIEFANQEGKKVLLPREVIRQWADFIERNEIPEKIGAQELRERVKADEGSYTPVLHSFETHLKPAAFALVAARRNPSFRSAYAVVPVGADWNSSESVLGYPDALNPRRYVSTPLLEVLLQAAQRPADPHFVLLDEMNLSHVERYFSTLLSAMESTEPISLYPGTPGEPGSYRVSDTGALIPPTVEELPANLFIIGTVNIDETTYMFSPKVLDRAHVIEFRVTPEDMASFLSNPPTLPLSDVDGQGQSYGQLFVEAGRTDVSIPDDWAGQFEEEVMVFFNALAAHGSEFGFRTTRDAARFMHFFRELAHDQNPVEFSRAFDLLIAQKLLPKLHGSRAKLSPVLKVLWRLCTTPVADRASVTPSDSTNSSSNSDPATDLPVSSPYPVSGRKISRMWQALLDHGFASFAEA
jgi:hypothetical protein